MAWIDFIVSLLVMQLLGGPLVQKKKSFSSQSSEQRLENDKISKGEFSGPVIIRENIWSWLGNSIKILLKNDCFLWVYFLGVQPH